MIILNGLIITPLLKNKKTNSFDIAMLKEALSESDLLFTVDVIDYNSLSEGFKKIIDQDGVPFFDIRPAYKNPGL